MTSIKLRTMRVATLPPLMDESTQTLVEQLAHRLEAEVVETHISWVLLVPGLAYKLKKPLRLPFLDYSTPERRAYFCAEEVRLNHRLAPSLYLGVARVTGTPAAPEFDGPGPTLDYAVKMRRFAEGDLFSARLEAGSLTPELVDRLADRIASFHLQAPIDAGPSAVGAAHLLARTLAALDGCATLFNASQLASLRAWIEREWDATACLWQTRRAAGWVRECHGDLHLANLVVLGGEVAAFDCIEFDASLRWIDVVEDVALALMDFVAHGQPGLGWRFMNAWLERTGDYEGVGGLRLCLVYRALVRAMASHMREAGCDRARHYVREALAWSSQPRARLFITHGLPGSGKTFASQQVLQQHGAIRIRSDVERKRLAGLDALACSQAAGLDLYTREASAHTYGRLLKLAVIALAAGFPVVLDAAFLQRGERDQASKVAHALHLPFAIVDCDAPLPVLRERLRTREHDASEANVTVLEKLLALAEPLGADERASLYGGVARGSFPRFAGSH